MPTKLWEEEPMKRRTLLTMSDEEKRRRFPRAMAGPYWSATARQYNLGAVRASPPGVSPQMVSPMQLAAQKWDVVPFQTPLQRETTRADILAQQRRPGEESQEFALGMRKGQAEAGQIESGSRVAEQAEARLGRRATSDIATAEQDRELGHQTMPFDVRKAAAGAIGAERGPQIAALDADIASIAEQITAAYEMGDAARGQALEEQLTELRNRRMQLVSQGELPIPQGEQQGQLPIPQGEPLYTTPPAPAGARVNFLAAGANRASQEADIMGAQAGLQGMLDTAEAPGLLSGLAEKAASDEESIYVMNQLLNSLQNALQQASPEAAQIILNSIRNNPGYMQIFQWQDADRMMSKEQMPGLVRPAGWSAYSRLTGDADRFSQAAELAQQIVRLVESGNAVGTGTVLPQ